MMKYLYLSCCLALYSFVGVAQTHFSLTDCIEQGLAQNYSLRIVRNQEEVARNNASLGNANYLPTVELGAGASGTLYNYNNDLTNGTSESLCAIGSEATNVGVDVNWTIFDGFGIQATYARLKELSQIGALSTRLSIEDFVADIAAEYFNLLRQEIRLSNMRSTLKLSRERLRIVETHYIVGVSSRLDLQQAKVDFNADSSNVLSQHQNLHASRIRLCELMARPDVGLDLHIVDTAIVQNHHLDEEGIRSNAIQTNTSLLIARKNITLSALDYKKVKSRNYPYVRLNAGYGYTSNWYGSGNTDQQQRWGANYGVTVGVPIFDGLNRRREQRNARVDIANKELQVKEVELNLWSDMSNMWMAYQNNLTLCDLEVENTTVAQDNYDIAIERYKLGDLSGIQLREAQNNLFLAGERLAEAQYAAKLCEISLLQLSGQIIPLSGTLTP